MEVLEELAGTLYQPPSLLTLLDPLPLPLLLLDPEPEPLLFELELELEPDPDPEPDPQPLPLPPLPEPLPEPLPLPLPHPLLPLLEPELPDPEAGVLTEMIVLVVVIGIVTVTGPPKPQSAGQDVVYVVTESLGV